MGSIPTAGTIKPKTHMSELQGTIDITCKCGHTEIIPCFEDKRGWHCDKCNTVWEVEPSGKMEPHLFHFLNNASFEPKHQPYVHTVIYHFRRLFK